jgi:hypothetical protein
MLPALSTEQSLGFLLVASGFELPSYNTDGHWQPRRMSSPYDERVSYTQQASASADPDTN